MKTKSIPLQDPKELQEGEVFDLPVIRLLLVDDHQIVIDGLKALLSNEKNIKIISDANNGKEALDIIDKIPIDIVITDINMPVMSGVELTKKIKSDFPEIKVLVLSMHNDKALINEVISAEAEGYVLKNTNRDELVGAINRIYDNGTYYSNEIVKIMTENIKPENNNEVLKSLSQREIEIIKLVCQECTSAEIADKLFLSPMTVDTHRKNILKKTHSKTAVSLVKFAIKNNIIGIL